MKIDTKISKWSIAYKTFLLGLFPINYSFFKESKFYIGHNGIKFLLISLFSPFYVSAQTETKIVLDSLPVLIKVELAKEYHTFKVNHITRNTDNKDSVTYRIELQKKNTMVKLIYDKNGMLISKQKSKVFTYDDTEKPKSAPKKHNDGHNHQH